VHAPIGSFRANAFGLHDLVGNVWSWCLDDHEYEREPREGDGLNGSTVAGEEGVLRGGGWFSDPIDLRSANRMLYGRSGREQDVGIQPVRKLD